MKITQRHLDAAVERQILTREQAQELSVFLDNQPNVGPSFSITHVLYYLGGLIAIGAMTLFMTLGWESFGAWGLLVISIFYAGAGLALTELFRRKAYAIPAGICAAFVVALTPLAIYALQLALGWWPDETPYRDYHRYIKWHWVFLELGTLAVGAVVAWRYKYPFLVMPIAATLWYMSMDLSAMIVGGRPEFDFYATVSMFFGLLMLVLAFWVDVRSRKTADYAFWLYVFGALAFWGGLTSQHSDDELSKFVYCCINMAMIGVGVILVRRVFVVLGALGATFYLGHLASTVFEDSLLFPFALTAIGLGIVCLGVLWQKNERAIEHRARQLLPKLLRELIESSRRRNT